MRSGTLRSRLRRDRPLLDATFRRCCGSPSWSIDANALRDDESMCELSLPRVPTAESEGGDVKPLEARDEREDTVEDGERCTGLLKKCAESRRQSNFETTRRAVNNGLGAPTTTL